MVGQVASLAVGFAPSILVARWLGPADRGLYAVLGTASGVALVIASLGVPMAVWYVSSAEPERGPGLLGDSLAYALVLSLVFVPAAWLLRHDLSSWFAHGHGEGAWVVAACLIPATFLDWTSHNQLLGGFRFGLYNALVVAQKAIFLVGVVVFLRILGLGVTGVLLATVAGSLFVFGGSLRALLPRAAPRLEAALFRRLVAYGTRTQIGGVFQYFNSRFDVLILQFFRPLSAVGYYVVAQILAELVMVLTRAFQSSVMSFVTHHRADEDTQAAATATSLRHHAILALAATAANAVFSPVLILFAYGSAFHAALLPFFIILPGIAFLGSGLVIANDLNARDRPGLASTLSGIAVGATVILDLALIPPFGVAGAAAASLVAYVGYGILSFAVASRVARIPLGLLLPRREDWALYAAAAARLLRPLRRRLNRGRRKPPLRAPHAVPAPPRAAPRPEPTWLQDDLDRMFTFQRPGYQDGEIPRYVRCPWGCGQPVRVDRSDLWAQHHAACPSARGAT